jgi:uncharacterized membrane protein (DUF485 family)
MDHGPAVPKEIEDPVDTARRARYGLVLFAVYLSLYGSFMLVNAFAPAWMQTTPAAGVNLAIWWGFGLIVAAMVLALVYAWLCRTPAKTD